MKCLRHLATVGHKSSTKCGPSLTLFQCQKVLCNTGKLSDKRKYRYEISKMNYFAIDVKRNRTLINIKKFEKKLIQLYNRY